MDERGRRFRWGVAGSAFQSEGDMPRFCFWRVLYPTVNIRRWNPTETRLTSDVGTAKTSHSRKTLALRCSASG